MDQDWSIEEMANYYAFGNGSFCFSGETCDKCKITANVPAGGPGWMCICGAFNAQSWNNRWMPHSSPIKGPTAEQIAEAVKLAETLNPKRFAFYKTVELS